MRLPHRCKSRQGSPSGSVLLGSAAGCKTCSLRWDCSFPTDNRDVLNLHPLRSCVLSSHGQVKVFSTGLQLVTVTINCTINPVSLLAISMASIKEVLYSVWRRGYTKLDVIYILIHNFCTRTLIIWMCRSKWNTRHHI